MKTGTAYVRTRLDCNVSVKSKLQHAPPGNPSGHLTFLKIIVQIPPYPGQNAVQMPHTRVHSGDQMPPPQGHLKTFHVIHHVGAHDLESADRLQ